MTDLEIVGACQSGDAGAFSELYVRYKAPLFRRAYSILRDEAASEDMTQNAMLKAFTNINGFEGKSSIATWLTRILINECLMHIRACGSKNALVVMGDTNSDDGPVTYNEVQESIPSDWLSPEDSVINAQMRDALHPAIENLNDKLRVAFILFEVEGFTAEECAKILGTTLAATKSRIYRSRVQLRSALVDFRPRKAVRA